MLKQKAYLMLKVNPMLKQKAYLMLKVATSAFKEGSQYRSVHSTEWRPGQAGFFYREVYIKFQWCGKVEHKIAVASAGLLIQRLDQCLYVIPCFVVQLLYNALPHLQRATNYSTGNVSALGICNWCTTYNGIWKTQPPKGSEHSSARLPVLFTAFLLVSQFHLAMRSVISTPTTDNLSCWRTVCLLTYCCRLWDSFFLCKEQFS